MAEGEPGVGIPSGGAELGADAERELRPEERERRERRVPRTLEIISHPGADRLAMRRAVRTMLSTMQDSREKLSRYSVEYLREALDNRVWNLPEGLSEEETGIRTEIEVLKAEVKARENLQGAWNNRWQFGGDVGEFSGLFLRTWLKATPTAEDFRILGNLSETPIRTTPIEEIVEQKSEVVEEIEEEKEDRKTGEPTVETRTRRVIRTQKSLELRGYKGEIKEGEEPLGLKIDKTLRTYVDIAVAKAPLWFLKEKVFKKLSLSDIARKREEIRQKLNNASIGYEKLSSFGADEPNEGEDPRTGKLGIAGTREWARNLVDDRDAEQIAYELFYVLGLATKFGVRIRDRIRDRDQKKGETEEEYKKKLPGLDREKFEVKDGKKAPAWKIEGFPASDDLIKLAHVELRRKAEANRNRKAGPPSTLDCYPDLIVSFLDFVKVPRPTPQDPEGTVSFWELWYERKKDKEKEIKSFGNLPWGKIRSEMYDLYLYQRWRANNVLGALMKVTGWDLGKEVLNTESWKGTHKDVQVAIGMLGYPKKKGKEIARKVKFNILGGAVISNLHLGGWIRCESANPPESTQTWSEIMQKTPQVIMGLLKYVVVERSGFLSEREWKEWKKSVAQKRRGVKTS